MTSKVHFISGLPRSGSTLLAAVLRQNPRFAAAATSPVALLWSALIPKMGGGGEFTSFFDDPRRARVLRAVFDGYHGEGQGERVVFDTNRSWTGKAALLRQVYPQARIICCVREVAWVIDSMERMLLKNPLQVSKVLGFQPGRSVYDRAEMLMSPKTGLVGLAWSTLREAWFSEMAERLVVVSYAALARNPALMMERLYAALDEAPFAHDFDKLSFETPAYDAELGMPGLHSVRDQVGLPERPFSIPPDLVAKYADMNFWLKPELNRRGAMVL